LTFDRFKLARKPENLTALPRLQPDLVQTVFAAGIHREGDLVERGFLVSLEEDNKSVDPPTFCPKPGALAGK
jgi:hypothetical protein